MLYILIILIISALLVRIYTWTFQRYTRHACSSIHFSSSIFLEVGPCSRPEHNLEVDSGSVVAENQESETTVEQVAQKEEKEEVELQQDAVVSEPENVETVDSTVDRSWIYYPPRKDAEDRHLNFHWWRS